MVRLVGQGLTYVEVAEEMDIAYRTVVSHAVRVRDQSGLKMPPRSALAHLYHRFPECWQDGDA